MKYTLTVTAETAEELVALLARRPGPLDAAAAPVQDAPVQDAPVQDAPVQDAPAPVQDAPAPVQDAPAPVQDAPVPVQDAPAPVQDAPAPVQDAPAPVQDAPAPVQDDDDDSAPADDSAQVRDGRGFPWDERIHASSKKLNVDGTWRYRRNTPEETIKAVEAELAGPALDVPDFLKKDASTASIAVPTGEAPAATIAVPTGEAPAATIAVPTGEAPAVTPAPAATYEQVIAMLTTALQSGQIAPEDLPKFWNDCGVEGAHQMVGNQPAIDAASMKLAALQG